MNYPSAFFENSEMAWVKQGQLQNFQKLPEPNMWLLANHIKPTNTLYWNWYLLILGNYKSVSGQLENSRQLQITPLS